MLLLYSFFPQLENFVWLLCTLDQRENMMAYVRFLTLSANSLYLHYNLGLVISLFRLIVDLCAYSVITFVQPYNKEIKNIPYGKDYASL